MDKKPFASKKFIAFFFSSLLIAGILVAALVTQIFTWPMAVFMAIGIFSLGFLTVGYILPQAALDKFVRGAENISSSIKPKEESPNGTNSEGSMEEV